MTLQHRTGSDSLGRTSRPTRFDEAGVVEQLARAHTEGVRKAHQATERDEVAAALDPAQRRNIKPQSVGCLLLGPAMSVTQLDHAPPNVSHDAVRALHTWNRRRLDLIETEVKYPRFDLSDRLHARLGGTVMEDHQNIGVTEILLIVLVMGVLLAVGAYYAGRTKRLTQQAQSPHALGSSVSTVPCAACGNTISTAALHCPRCGHPAARS